MSNNLNQEGRELLIHNLKEEKEVENKKPEDEKEGELYNIQRNLNEDSTYDKSIKVILLGDSMVGKSSVINRLCNQTFDESIGPTICIEHYNYLIKVNDYTIRMQIWDTAGQEKYNSIINKYYANTDLAIYVYSIDNLESFHRIKDWMLCCEEKNAEKENNETKNILLGNKKDLGDEMRKVSMYEAEKFSKNNNFLIFREISCKNDDKEEIKNFLDIFDEIGKYYYLTKRKNSSQGNESLNYFASKSLIEMINSNEKEKGKKKKKKKKQCC